MSIQEKRVLKKMKRLEAQKLDAIRAKASEQKIEEENATNLLKGSKRKREENPAFEDSSGNFEDGPKKSKQTQAETETTPRNDEQTIAAPQNLDVLTDITFESFKDRISDKTLKAIAEKGYTRMTEIQAKTLPKLLKGCNLVGCSKTGSGKTLAFLIPLIERLHQAGFTPANGTGAIILCPTKELCLQTYTVLAGLIKYHSQTICLLVGKSNRQAQVDKLFHGACIVVATPGRLLDHMKNTPDFKFDRVLSLVIDETDRMLEIGFLNAIKEIVSLIPKILPRQNILFSATQNKTTDSIKALLGTDLKLRYVSIGDGDATPKGIQQQVVICPSEDKLHVLYAILKKAEEKLKVIVFFSTCKSVQFHYKLFAMTLNTPPLSIYGTQTREERNRAYRAFIRSPTSVLLCTGIAARGLDFPLVNWVIQYDPPDSRDEYVHRMGRTARGEASKGKSLLFLRPEEREFAAYLAACNIGEIYESDYNLTNEQELLEDQVWRIYASRSLAAEAFRACLSAYKSHPLKRFFNVNNLDLTKVCRSFGLQKPPPLIEPSSTEKKKGGRFQRRREAEELGVPYKNVQQDFWQQQGKVVPSGNKYETLPFFVDAK